MVLFSARSDVLDAMSPTPSYVAPTSPSQPRASTSTSHSRRRDPTTPRRKRAAAAQPMDGISDEETRSARHTAAMDERREEFEQHLDRARFRSQQARARESQPRKHKVVVEIISDSEEERRAASELAEELDDSGDVEDLEDEDEDEEEVVPLPNQTGARQFPIELSPEPEDDAQRLEQYARMKEFEREAERRKEYARARRERERQKEEEEEEKVHARRYTPGKARDRELRQQEQLVAEALQALSTKWSVAEETVRQRATEEKGNEPAGPSNVNAPFNRPRDPPARGMKEEHEWQWRGNEFAEATERIRRQAEATRAAEAEQAERGEQRRTVPREDSPEVEIIDPLPDLAKMQRIRAQFQAAERQLANKRRQMEDRLRRKMEAEEAAQQKQADELRVGLEQARRQVRAEERAKKQREEAARQVREERERRLDAQQREFQRQLEEAERERRRQFEAEQREREAKREAEERFRKEQEARERLMREAEARLREEAERRRREQERHTERIRREQQRQQQQQQQQQQRRGTHNVFGDDADPLDPFSNFRPRQFPGFGGFGEGFTFHQFTDASGRTYTRAGFAHTSPPAPGSSRAAGSTSSPLRAKARPKLNNNPASEDVGAAYIAYEQRWAGLGALPDHPAWTFSTIPWPVTYPISSPHGLEPLAVRRFLLATVHSQGKSKKERVRAAMLRWHPDKFCPKWLGKVRESDRDAVREGVNAVSRILQDLQAECV